MRLAVLLYANAVENPEGLPNSWPAVVQELKEESPSPVAPWLEMQKWEYDDYRTAHQSDYDAWFAALPPVPPQPNPDV